MDHVNKEILEELRLLREEVKQLRIPKRIPLVHPMDVKYWSLQGKIEGIDYRVGVGIP